MMASASTTIHSTMRAAGLRPLGYDDVLASLDRPFCLLGAPHLEHQGDSGSVAALHEGRGRHRPSRPGPPGAGYRAFG